jgi:hypothetical protein
MSDRENLLKNEYKLIEKEKDRLLKDLQNIKLSIKMKESDVKSDISKIWTEWQEKYDGLEEELTEYKSRLNHSEVERKKVAKENLEVKRDNREVQA